MINYLNNIKTPSDLKPLSITELKILCGEIREFLEKAIAHTGGHLGSSLGAVEICVALHKVFNTPTDKLIFDIGHQAYAHKLLTLRKDLFHTLRQKDGISGFSNPWESEYDEITGGHSSTSLSAGLGQKKALELQGDFKTSVVAIIGDAAIGAGISLEALNDIGSSKSKMIIILNDNNMSISKTEGALSAHLSKMRASYKISKIKDIKDTILDKLPQSFVSAVKQVEDKANNFISSKEGSIVENLGFSYIGPIDGHNIGLLVELLSDIKDSKDNKPILLHVITQKGKGGTNLEKSPDCLHGIEGEINKSDNKNLSNSTIFVNKLIQCAQEDKNIVAISAAMLTGTGLEKFQKIYPLRTFDVGIAEQHAVTFSAGLAKQGMKPFVCIYSTFMQRAYDQVLHDISITSLPVRFVMDRAGFVGQDGATHHGIFDYSMFLPLPNIVFMAPSCKEDLEEMITLMKDINDKPSFIRFSKSKLEQASFKREKVELGKGQIIKQGKNLQGKGLLIISLGEILHNILEATKDLNLTIIDMKFAKPLDENLIIKLAKTHNKILTVEEGMSSIFSSMVVDVLQQNKLLSKVEYHNIKLPDMYIEHASVSQQQTLAKIDSSSLNLRIKNILS